MIAPILLVCILLALAATAYLPDNDRRELPTAPERDSRSLLARGSVSRLSFRPGATRWLFRRFDYPPS